MKASDLFLRCLESEGVKLMFGVPGEENADVMMSLIDSPIEFILCRHEQGAAFMADVVGRLTGRPGVCLATLGPGATNLVTGVASANMDRSPLVAITGQGATTRLHKESHQIMDAVGLFRPITKWAASIYDAQNIAEVVRKAFKLATREKPGATHIELPEDIAKNDVIDAPIVPGQKVRRPIPDEKAIQAAVDLLSRAERPVILAGNGCIRTRVSNQLNRFVEATGIHVACTFMGKGAISDRHSKSLFTAGLGSRDHVTSAFEQADLVIAIGYDMVEWHPSRWNLGCAKTLLHLDFEPAEVDGAYRPDVELVGDVAAALWAINERLEHKHQWTVPAFERERRHMLADLEEGCDASFPMKPQRILMDLRQEMGDEDIVISDVGAHKMWVARNYPTYAPHSCLISNGFCSMGIALPGAIAAKLVRPNRKVVAVCGDGGFMMNIQELATASQYGIAPTVLVWDDAGFGLIAWKQQINYGKTSHTRFVNPDLVDVARSFGCRAERVERAEDLKAALRRSFADTRRPSVVVVPVDYSENLKLTQRLGELIGH